jgi:Protein of unknown function (DUF2917)
VAHTDGHAPICCGTLRAALHLSPKARRRNTATFTEVAMLKFQGPVVLHLRDGELLRCDQACLIRVMHGRVWITQMHDLDDHFLDAGQSLALRGGAHAMVGAEGAAQVALAAAPSRLDTLRRLLRSWAAAPRATIAAWSGPPTLPT